MDDRELGGLGCGWFLISTCGIASHLAEISRTISGKRETKSYHLAFANCKSILIELWRRMTLKV